MRKSEERKEIESLAIGDKVSFPKEEYLRIVRMVTNLNREHRAKWLIKPDEIRYRVDSEITPGEVTVIRDM